jgi:hypothetical protein
MSFSNGVARQDKQDSKERRTNFPETQRILFIEGPVFDENRGSAIRAILQFEDEFENIVIPILRANCGTSIKVELRGSADAKTVRFRRKDRLYKKAD